MQYVIIKSGGKQYKVSTGDTISVDKLDLDGKEKIDIDDVLLCVNEGDVSIGQPMVKGATVEATLVENKKDEKIRVMRFKAKSRYRRTIGFRAQKTVLKIDKINFGSNKSVKEVEQSSKTESKTSKS